MEIPKLGVESFIRNLAKQAGVDGGSDVYLDMAETMARLSDKEVEPDEILNILVKLGRKGLIQVEDAFDLYEAYEKECGRSGIAARGSSDDTGYHCTTITEEDLERGRQQRLMRGF